jgi:hypothetical protein
MGDAEDFKAEDFKMFLETQGIALVKLMDENQEMPYKAKCFINAKGTIGYAEVDIQDRHEIIFLSKTAKGDVITLTGEPAGALPIKADGIHAIFSVPEKTPIESEYVQHLKAFGGEVPLVDVEYLQQQVPKLPQRALDVAMAAMNEFLSAFGGAGGLMEAMGNMMTGMMDGIGKGLGEAMAGLGDVEAKPVDVKTEGPKPVKAPRPAPKKAARPAKKKAPSKAKPKKKASKPKRKK